MYKRTGYETGKSKVVPNIICNNCGCKVKSKMEQVGYIRDEGIIAEGLICSKCGKKYLATVTDNQLRADIVKAGDMKNDIDENQYKCKMEYQEFTKRQGYVPYDVRVRWADKLNSLIREYNKIVTSNRERGKELKTEYMRKWYNADTGLK